MTTQSPAPLLQTGVAPPLAAALVIVAVLFALITLTAVVHLRTGQRAAWLGLGAVTVLLITAVVLTVITLGLSLLWLAPAVVLAVAAASVARDIPGRRSRKAV